MALFKALMTTYLKEFCEELHNIPGYPPPDPFTWNRRTTSLSVKNKERQVFVHTHIVTCL